MGSWLFRFKTGWGCLACKAAGRSDSFGTFTAKAQPFAFQRHGARSQAHRDAVAALLGKAVDPPAPSAGAFELVLDHYQQGQGRAAAGVPTVGKRKKVRVMGFCLAEAVRTEHRRFLANAESITIMQDCRGHRLLMRFK
ncbi:unnamed protein product, partial [Prorocentrum cordatum]